MGNEDNSDLQFHEVDVLADFLSCEAKTTHKNSFNDLIELKEEPVPMNESRQFVETVALLKSYETRKGSYTIKNKSCLDIMDSYLFEI